MSAPAVRDRDFILSRVAVSDRGCWIWQGSIGVNGTRAMFNGEYAYRISYLVFVGPIRDGLQINHHCDDGTCVNPEHLYAGTKAQNSDDAKRRGRMVVPAAPHGEAHHQAYPETMVDEARSLYGRGDLTQEQVADLVGASPSAVADWVRGTWRGRPRIRRARAGCGTRAGYCAHVKKKQPACDPCREANRIYMRAYKAARKVAA